MSNRESRTVSFTPEQAHFLDECVRSGRYQSVSEVVRAGIRLLAHEETTREAAVERVRQMIDVGAQELDRDEVVDGEAVFRRLLVRRERMRRKTAS
ncbi:MAG: type II toxin-antitoxin system ParD family antitoxin [Myxococcota bacterium]